MSYAVRFEDSEEFAEYMGDIGVVLGESLFGKNSNHLAGHQCTALFCAVTRNDQFALNVKF